MDAPSISRKGDGAQTRETDNNDVLFQNRSTADTEEKDNSREANGRREKGRSCHSQRLPPPPPPSLLHYPPLLPHSHQRSRQLLQSNRILRLPQPLELPQTPLQLVLQERRPRLEVGVAFDGAAPGVELVHRRLPRCRQRYVLSDELGAQVVRGAKANIAFTAKNDGFDRGREEGGVGQVEPKILKTSRVRFDLKDLQRRGSEVGEERGEGFADVAESEVAKVR